MLFPVFETPSLLRQNVLRNEPLQLYLYKIKKRMSYGIKFVRNLFLSLSLNCLHSFSADGTLKVEQLVRNSKLK